MKKKTINNLMELLQRRERLFTERSAMLQHHLYRGGTLTDEPGTSIFKEWNALAAHYETAKEFLQVLRDADEI